MDDLKQLVAAHGQQHLLAHWNRLSPPERDALDEQIRAVDFKLLDRLLKDDAKATDWNAVAAKAKSPRSIRLNRDDNEFTLEAARRRGAEALRAGQVGFVDDQEIRNLKHPRLDPLYFVAALGGHYRQDGLRDATDIDLVLADADGLDQYVFFAQRIEKLHRLDNRAGNTAQASPRRQASDKHAVVKKMIAHADAVAQKRAAADRQPRPVRPIRTALLSGKKTKSCGFESGALTTLPNRTLKVMP